MNAVELKKLLIEEAKNQESQIIEFRRWFHQHPETGFEEYATSAYIEEKLRKLGYKIIKTAQTGLIAVLQGAKPGKTIGLRADMDALNVQEDTGLPFSSQNPGKMHACGHDTHMAMLLGAAMLLAKHRDQVVGTIKLIFQPFEEGGSGAKFICDEGHLDDLDEVFGIHIWMETQAGLVAIASGPIMAGIDSFEIKIKGKGGHAAQPQLTIDPTSVAVDIYDAIQKLGFREVDPFKPVIITTPLIKAANAFNVIPQEVIIQGSLRTFDLKLQSYLIGRIQQIAEGYSKAWRCECEFRLLTVTNPPVINSDRLAKESVQLLSDVIDGVTTEVSPTMGAEDFAFYLQKASEGVFILLGSRNEAKQCIYAHHHPKFTVDESVLWKGVATYAILGLSNIFTKK